MALQDYSIHEITYREAMDCVIKNHYLHRKCPCSKAFGLFLNGELKGVVVYGTPSSSPLRIGIAGGKNKDNVIELSRLWVCDDVPKNGESFLIGNTIKKAGKDIVVSYADTDQKHLGVVYQATNWLYTGLSAKRTNWTIAGVDKHCQTIADKYTSTEIREKYGDAFSLQPRSRKHRYVFITAKGTRKKELLADLKYPILPYPKAEILDLFKP